MEKSTQSVLFVTKVTEDQIRQMNREYNAREWDKRIDRLSTFKNIEFFVAAPQKGYEYSRYYAKYEIPEGIILFTEFDYSSSLTSNGFCRIQLVPGRDNLIEVFRILLKDLTGKEGRCANDRPNRDIMARNSQVHGAVFSNQF